MEQQILKKHYSYDPESGIFTRLKTTKGHPVGEAAGTTRRDRYVVIGIDRKKYLAHRLAWLYVYGYTPVGIDHIDGNPSNNKLSNLREATQAENMQNKSPRGVTFCKRSKRWVSQIKIDGRIRYVGSYSTEDEALSAYQHMKRLVHPFYQG